MNDFGSRLFKMRIDKKLARDALGAKIGVSKTAIKNWEDGENVPKIEYIHELSKFFGVSHDFWFAKNATNSIDDISVSEQSGAIINNGVNNGTQIGTQNLTQTLIAEDVEGTPKESLNLKSLPLFDIDDGVKYALCDDDKAQIVGRAKQSTIFIAEDSKAFGVFVMYELSWVMPTPIHVGEILVVEPCMPPRSGDLVLLCVGYPNEIRGMFARLHADINNKYNVQYDESKPVPMPTGSVICGVVRKTSRELIDGDIAKSRLNTDYSPLGTLVG